MRDDDAMRQLLIDYCRDTHCNQCPLKSPVCRCGCGTFFDARHAGSTEYDMAPQEIKDAYDTVRSSMLTHGGVPYRAEWFTERDDWVF